MKMSSGPYLFNKYQVFIQFYIFRNNYTKQRFRMINYDACETWRPQSDAEYEAGMKTKLYFESSII